MLYALRGSFCSSLIKSLLSIQKKKIKCEQRTHAWLQTRFTCGLWDHLGHHHLIQVKLPLSYTPAGGTPSIPFDLRHCDKECHKQIELLGNLCCKLQLKKYPNYLVLLSKKPAVMLWLATPSLCSAAALTCSSTVWTLIQKKWFFKTI